MPWDPAFYRVKLKSSLWPSGRILIADDDDDSRNAFQALLEAWGYQVEAADSGQQVLEIAQSNYPSVAFIDLDMPGMSGYKLAAQLRQLAPRGSKLFAVSTNISAAPENRLFDGLFQKPIDPDKIWNLLRQSFSLCS